MRDVARRQADAGPVEAYRFLANEGRLRHLGPAFGTKYLHFVPQATSGEALVLDAIVCRAIRKLADISLRPWQWRTAMYERYLSLVDGLAGDIGIAPSDVEMLLFVSELEVSGRWSGCRPTSDTAGDGVKCRLPVAALESHV
ncbi:MAG: hypothetical protein RIB65_03520 [Ilumatobacter fluminis]